MKLRIVAPLMALCSMVGSGCSADEQAAPQAAKKAAAPLSLPSKAITPDEVRLDNMAVNVSLSPQAGDAQRGIEVMTDRKRGNCVTCHQVSALPDVPFQGNVGPSLDGVADRWKEGFLRSLIVNPKTFFPNTVMPAYFRTSELKRVRDEFAGKPILTAQEVEDVIAFLKTLRQTN